MHIIHHLKYRYHKHQQMQRYIPLDALPRLYYSCINCYLFMGLSFFFSSHPMLG